MNRKAIAIAASIVLAFSQIGSAADLPQTYNEVPSPPVEQVGIWGAIAYSQADGKHGFFWGADKRQEAEDIAVEYCENAGGKKSRHAVLYSGRHVSPDESSVAGWGSASGPARAASLPSKRPAPPAQGRPRRPWPRPRPEPRPPHVRSG